MHEGFLKEGTPIHPRFMKVGYCWPEHKWFHELRKTKFDHVADILFTKHQLGNIKIVGNTLIYPTYCWLHTPMKYKKMMINLMMPEQLHLGNTHISSNIRRLIMNIPPMTPIMDWLWLTNDNDYNNPNNGLTIMTPINNDNYELQISYDPIMDWSFLHI